MTAYRNYNTPTVDMDLAPSKNCDRCGTPIYFIQQHTQKRGTHWVVYEDAGHGGGGLKVLKFHKCKEQS